MHSFFHFERTKQIWLRLWSNYAVAECPDGQIENVREERIRRIYQDVALLNNIHAWEEQTRQDRIWSDR